MIAVVGDVLIDAVVAAHGPRREASDTAADINWRPGGSAASTATWLAKLGVAVRLLGRVGADVIGQGLITSLQDAGVETRLAEDPHVATGTVVAVVTGDERDMFTDRGASGHLSPADLPMGWLDGVTHLHLSGYLLLHSNTRAAGLEALRQADDAGVAVSVDPSSTAPLSNVGRDAFLSWLPTQALLTPNLAEAQYLSQHEEPVQAARHLGGMTGEAVVTCGPRGAIWSDGTTVLQQPLVEVGAIGIDPVGAGDAFTAGFLAARLAGRPPAEQLADGISVAACAVTGTVPAS